jgi:hypothetical protein
VKPTKKLSLKRELLTELTNDEMQSVVGAAQVTAGLTNTCGCTATNTCVNISNISCNVSRCNALC